MPTINVYVNEHDVTIDNDAHLSPGSANWDTLKFTFDSSWTGLKKYASLTQDKVKFYKIALSNNECKIGAAPLTLPGRVYIGAYGDNADGTVATTDLVAVDLFYGSANGKTNLTTEQEELFKFVKKDYVGYPDQFVNSLNSFYENRGNLVYDQRCTPMDKNWYSGSRAIDCSTFIALCLMGNAYETSTYANNQYPPVTQASWAIDMVKHDVRNAAEICEFLTKMGLRIPFTKKTVYTAADAEFDDLRTGDILFFSRLGDGESKGRYLDITHVAAIWNIGHQYPIMEVTTPGDIPYPVKRSSFEVRGHGLVAVCRPRFNVTNVGESERAGLNNENMTSLEVRLQAVEESGGGGGTGSVVAVNPIVNNGTKIAEITVNGNVKSLYVPLAYGGNVDGVEPNLDDVPRLYWEGTAPKSKAEGTKVGKFSYRSKTMSFDGYASLAVQGNSSTVYNKKNFTIKLYKDAGATQKQKKNFKGWGDQTKYVLKANWIDLTHARNVVSARIWSDVVASRSNYYSMPENVRTSPNNCAVDGFPVVMFINGVYQGRYSMNIPKDPWMFNMDNSLDNHCVLCGEDYNSACFRAPAKIDETDWSDEIHDTVPESIKTRWNEVISFVRTSSDSDFVNGIDSYIDLQSLIDYYIFAYVSCGLDSLGKNQLYMTYNGTKWYATMYDMDSTWGLYWDGSKFVSSQYKMQSDYEVGVHGTSNLLYDRLLRNFADDIKARYNELRNGSLSVSNLVNRFEEFTSIVNKDVVAEDYASTTGGGAFTGIPSKTTNNIQQIRSFIVARLAYVDGMIGSSDGGTETPDIPDVPITPPDTPSEPSGEVEYPTADHVLYNLSKPFACDGTTLKYIDTGIKLRDSNKPFTVLLDVVISSSTDGQRSILHANNENGSPWSGLGLQILTDSARYQVDLNTDVANTVYFDGLDLSRDLSLKIAISYDGTRLKLADSLHSNINAKDIVNYLNGFTDQTLWIGAYRDTLGRVGRFFNGTINECIILDCEINNATMTEYTHGQSPTYTPVVSGNIPSADKIMYQLPAQFVGGTNKYIDTGIKLRDSNKPFTIAFEGVIRKNSTDLAVLHANQENGAPYSGFGIQAIGRANKLIISLNTSVAHEPMYTVPFSTSDVYLKFAVTYDGSTLKSCTNLDMGVVSTTIANPASGYNNRTLWLGAYRDTAGTAGRFLDGTVDNLVIYDCAVSDDVLKELCSY